MTQNPDTAYQLTTTHQASKVRHSDHNMDVTDNDADDADETKDSNTELTHCELCGRSDVELTRHHLIPRARHNKSRTKRYFSKTEMTSEIALLCRPCHNQVHHLFANHELADYYHTVERLRAHSEMAKFIRWIQKRPAGLKVRVRS